MKDFRVIKRENAGDFEYVLEKMQKRGFYVVKYSTMDNHFVAFLEKDKLIDVEGNQIGSIDVYLKDKQVMTYHHITSLCKNTTHLVMVSKVLDEPIKIPIEEVVNVVRNG